MSHIMTGPFHWSAAKNEWLRRTRDLGFEDVVDAIEGKRILDEYPNPALRYAHQRVVVVEIGGYAVIVPYVRGEDGVFFKTAYPDRRARRKYLDGRHG